MRSDDFIKSLDIEFVEPKDHHNTGFRQPENAGCIFHHEGRVLSAVVQAHPGVVLEVGAMRGVSTRYICEALDIAGKGKVYSVDLHHQWPDDPGWPRRIIVSANSRSYVPPEPCLLAFIDGDHSREGVQSDLSLADSSGCQYILCHDAHPTASCTQHCRQGILDWVTDHPKWSRLDIRTTCGLLWLTKSS